MSDSRLLSPQNQHILIHINARENIVDEKEE